MPATSSMTMTPGILRAERALHAARRPDADERDHDERDEEAAAA